LQYESKKVIQREISPEHRVDYPCGGITGVVEDRCVPDAALRGYLSRGVAAHTPWRLVDEHLQVGELFEQN
jgi:hypothetical protein